MPPTFFLYLALLFYIGIATITLIIFSPFLLFKSTRSFAQASIELFVLYPWKLVINILVYLVNKFIVLQKRLSKYFMK